MFNSVFSRGNLPRIRDIVYALNLDDKQSKETHWVSLFNFFRIEFIQQEVLTKIKENPSRTIYLEYKIMILSICGFYYTSFIEYMPAGKN